jgi:hypothetical protein
MPSVCFTKFMVKNTQNKNNSYLLVGFIAVVTVAFGMLLKHHLDSRMIDDSVTHNIIQLTTDISNLKTCYDNSIKPCTPDAIKAFNVAHGLYPQ